MTINFGLSSAAIPTHLKPTPGRVLWYFTPQAYTQGEQPQAGLVAKVLNDRCVNLCLMSPNGDPAPALAVRLLQDGDEIPSDRPFACWMPFQANKPREDAALAIKVQELTARLTMLEDIVAAKLQPVPPAISQSQTPPAASTTKAP